MLQFVAFQRGLCVDKMFPSLWFSISRCGMLMETRRDSRIMLALHQSVLEGPTFSVPFGWSTVGFELSIHLLLRT